MDSDGDGADDCAELNDGDSWTDPGIFNGMHVRWQSHCSPSPLCFKIDTLAEVNGCLASQPIKEEKDQYSGWDWNNPPDNICSAGYAFQPGWTLCNDSSANSWAADWTGYIYLATDGTHCFSITGGTQKACGALFFNSETQAGTTNSEPKCYNVAAGAYPIRWRYEMDAGSTSNMHVLYCSGGPSPCTPAVAIPVRMLRASYP